MRTGLAQHGKIPRVGFLAARSREAAVEVAPFLDGMRELGYVEGKNIRYEWRFADGNYDRLRSLADELVALKVDVIAASSGPSGARRHLRRQAPVGGEAGRPAH